MIFKVKTTIKMEEGIFKTPICYAENKVKLSKQKKNT